MNARHSLLFLLVSALLVGCGTATQTANAPPAAQPTVAAPTNTTHQEGTQPTATTSETFTTLDGKTFALGGGHPAAVLFITRSCGSCIVTVNAWRQAVEHGPAKSLRVLVVDIDPTGTPANLQEFRATLASDPFQWAQDSSGNLARHFNITSLDTTVLFDGNGREVYRENELSSADHIAQAVKQVQQ